MVDYERYAQAEAALAWLNWRATLDARPPLSPAMLIGPWFDELQRQLAVSGIRIVHLKAIDRSSAGWVKVAVTGNSCEPGAEGMLDASPAARHEVTLNLRATGEPAAIEAVVNSVRGVLQARVRAERMQCFRPAAPKRPEVVQAR
jgi:hypothetical protein